MKLKEYWQSDNFKLNIVKAKIKSQETQSNQKLERTKEYSLSPVLCLCCEAPLDYKTTTNKVN